MKFHSLLVLWLMTFAMSGCYTEKKATRQIAKVHAIHPIVLARFCSNTFPPVTSTDTFIRFKPGKIVVISDTVRDTTGGVIREYITDTIYKTDTLDMRTETVLVDRAKVVELEFEIEGLQQEIASRDATIHVLEDKAVRLKKRAKNAIITAVVFGVILLSMIFSKIKNVFSWFR